MTTHNEIVKALNAIGAKEWSLNGDKIEDIIWLTDDQKTEAEIKAALGL